LEEIPETMRKKIPLRREEVFYTEQEVVDMVVDLKNKVDDFYERRDGRKKHGKQVFSPTLSLLEWWNNNRIVKQKQRYMKKEIVSIWTVTNFRTKEVFEEAIDGDGMVGIKFLRSEYPRYSKFVLEGYEVDGKMCKLFS
jgi:hypothetical protein